MDALKKCPFCGGEAHVEQIPQATWDKFVVTCKSRKCCAFYIGYIDEGIYNTKTEAIAAWNSRKPVEDVLERLKKEENDLFSARKALSLKMYSDFEILEKSKMLLEKELTLFKVIEIIKEVLN